MLEELCSSSRGFVNTAHLCFFSSFRITKNFVMESVKYTVAKEADGAVKVSNNNKLPDNAATAPDSHNNNNPVDNGHPSSSHNNNNTNVKVVAASSGSGEVIGDVASDNKAPDDARALPSSHTSSHNNNNNTNQVLAGATALPDQDVVMVEVGLALANSLARAMEDVPSDARAWTPIQFPDGVLGMVALHPDTTVGAINGRLANMFGPRCWFLGFQMVAGYTIAAPPRYTMRDLGELRTDLAIGSFMEDYYEE